MQQLRQFTGVAQRVAPDPGHQAAPEQAQAQRGEADPALPALTQLEDARHRLGQAFLGKDPPCPQLAGEAAAPTRRVDRRQDFVGCRARRLAAAQVETAKARRLAPGVALEDRFEQRLQRTAEAFQAWRQAIQLIVHLAAQGTEFDDRLGQGGGDFLQRLLAPARLPGRFGGERRGPAEGALARLLGQRREKFLKPGRSSMPVITT